MHKQKPRFVLKRGFCLCIRLPWGPPGLGRGECFRRITERCFCLCIRLPWSTGLASLPQHIFFFASAATGHEHPMSSSRLPHKSPWGRQVRAEVSMQDCTSQIFWSGVRAACRWPVSAPLNQRRVGYITSRRQFHHLLVQLLGYTWASTPQHGTRNSTRTRNGRFHER